MDQLVLQATQAYGIEAKAPLLRTHVGGEVKLAGCVAVDVAIQASQSKARFRGLTIVRWVEFLLRKRGQQQAKPVQLNRSQNLFEEPVVIVDRYDFAA